MARSPRPRHAFRARLSAVALFFVVAACGQSHEDAGTGGASTTGGNSGANATGGASETGGASGTSTTGGASETGGRSNGGANASGGVSATGGTAGDDSGGTAGDAGSGATQTGGAPNGGTTGGGGALGGSTNGGTAGGAGETKSALALSPTDGLFTGVRYYTGSTPSNRTSGPAMGPSQTFRLHNAGPSAASVTASVSGSDATRFEITSPASFPVTIAPDADADVTLRLVTANSALGTAPAQDDGATVFEATLTATSGPVTARTRLYALVLTYVELEPTFGQILDAFPDYTSMLPNSIRNDANPNPATLPGVEAGTDEVRAPVFRRADPGMPVTMRPIARFSPPGLVPFGWYRPGAIASRATVGTLAEATDAHTNDKSRMLLPPLASGATSFEPTETTFGLFMTPSGVGLLATEDAQGFDGAHRCKVWTLRNGTGAVRPNEYLIGGEEAANGDYQDYVFIVTNVTPMP